MAEIADTGRPSWTGLVLSRFDQAVAQSPGNRGWRAPFIAGLTFFFIWLCFYIDAGASPGLQNWLGVVAWVYIMLLLRGEDNFVRLQVLVAIAFATLGEHFASVYMQAYIYRLDNVPAFVPPGHGAVYLSALLMSRSWFFKKYARELLALVLVSGTVWSFWGGFIGSRGDVLGGVLFGLFVLCVLVGRSPLLYLGAFFITSWLEVVGTSLGNWSWAVNEPVFGLPQGNPPSGVAAWYCLVDWVALTGAPALLIVWGRLRSLAGLGTKETKSQV